MTFRYTIRHADNLGGHSDNLPALLDVLEERDLQLEHYLQTRPNLINRQIIEGSAAATVDFPSIPEWVDNLVLMYRCRSDTAAAASQRAIGLRFNADTANNYRQKMHRDGVLDVSSAASAQIWIGRINGQSLGVNSWGQAHIIDAKQNAAGVNRPTVIAQSSMIDNDGIPDLFTASGLWGVPSSISSVKVMLSGADTNFDAGSAFWLYGYP